MNLTELTTAIHQATSGNPALHSQVVIVAKDQDLDDTVYDVVDLVLEQTEDLQEPQRFAMILSEREDDDGA